MEVIMEHLAGATATHIYLTAFGVLLLCGFGFPMPEDIVLFILGYFSYRGDVTLEGSIMVALAGVMVGDSTIWAIGRFSGEKAIELPIARRILTRKRMDAVGRAFEANGPIYLFFARFAPGIRSVTFWSAGTLGIRFRTFFLLDGVAALISVPLFTYVGYWLGEAFHSSIGDVRKTVGLIGLVALGIIGGYTIKYIRKRRLESPYEAADDEPVTESEN